jgi:hypothetical protein
LGHTNLRRDNKKSKPSLKTPPVSLPDTRSVPTLVSPSLPPPPPSPPPDSPPPPGWRRVCGQTCWWEGQQLPPDATVAARLRGSRRWGSIVSSVSSREGGLWWWLQQPGDEDSFTERIQALQLGAEGGTAWRRYDSHSHAMAAQMREAAMALSQALGQERPPPRAILDPSLGSPTEGNSTARGDGVESSDEQVLKVLL